jgi:hypothetical protein
MSTRSPSSALLIIAALGILLFSQLADAQSWNNHSRDSQHTALSSVASQPLNRAESMRHVASRGSAFSSFLTLGRSSSSVAVRIASIEVGG